MTLHEARTRLAEMWPGKTVCMSAEAWRSCYTDGTHGIHTVYEASIIPGIDDESCTTWEGGDFETVLLQAEAALHPRDSGDQDCEVE